MKPPKMTSIGEKINSLGLTLDDYKGAVSTLCGGCGHDSITAAIVQACFEIELNPQELSKMSGIGCSSKTPGYFLSGSHGFNSVHGRMPSVTTGAYLAHSQMKFLGVSGDGDSGSIGIGQLIHAIRRRLNMLYIVENNGVYGLTKGQFSATADAQSQTRKGVECGQDPIDLARIAIECGAPFVARSFSGDKKQLVPLIQAGLSVHGFSFLDVVSPCVSFNDHQGSTKSYQYTRKSTHEATHIQDYVLQKNEIKHSTLELEKGIELHDGSFLRTKNSDQSYNINDKAAAFSFLDQCREEGCVPTGLIYFDSSHPKCWHDFNKTVVKPLRDFTLKELSLHEKNMNDVNCLFR